MRKLPEELAAQVLALFPDDDLIADQVERGGLALPGLIRITAWPTLEPGDVLATFKAIDTYEVKYDFILKGRLKAKAETIEAGEPWGFDTPAKRSDALLLAMECETELKIQPLVAVV